MKKESATEIIVAPYETFVIVQDQRTHVFTGPAKIIGKQNVLVKASLDYILKIANEKGFDVHEGSSIYSVIQHLKIVLISK